MMRNLEIYFHIPFCIQKCLYCDFLSGPADESVRERYMQALLQETRERAAEFADCHVVSIYIGGGTPTVVDPAYIAELLTAVKECYIVDEDAEISMECNPGTVTLKKLRIYREAGLNRLSIGLQSAHDEELKKLGRIHTFEQFLNTYRWAEEAGFTNVNVDLMSALPGQNLETWCDSLKKVLALEPAPKHISAYSLIIEEGTPFADMDFTGESALPDEDTDRAMYDLTKRILREAGYERYEISNYAKAGYACRHNVGYWTGCEYVGFGIGAASFADGKRFSNTRKIEEYIADPLNCRENVTTLTVKDRMEETMFLGLRMIEGVSEEEFSERFGVSMNEVYGDVIKRHISEGLLVREADRVRLTARGLDVSNYVMADFLLDE